MKAIISGRCSDARQATGDTQRRQMEDDSAAVRFCQQHGWEVAEKGFDKGFSAFDGTNWTSKKSKLADFLARIEDGKIGKGYVIVFENFDRFSRKQPFVEVAGKAVQVLAKGVWLASVQSGLVLTPENCNDLGNIIRFFSEVCLGYEESRKKGNRIKENWDKFLKDGKIGDRLPGSTPSWIYWDKEYKVDDKKAKVMKLIFRLGLEGMPVNQIMKQLNIASIPTFRSKVWRVSTLLTLLRHEGCIGLYKGKKFFPAIIDENDFNRMQAILNKNKKRKNSKTKRLSNLFTGLMINSVDGSNGILAAGGKGFRLYSADAWSGKSEQPSFAYIPFERAFLKFFRELTEADLIGEDYSQEIAALEGALAKVENDIVKLHASRKKHDFDMLIKLAGELEAERQEATAALEAARNKNQLSNLTRSHASTVNTLDLMADTDDGAPMNELRARIKGRISQIVNKITFRIIKNKDSRFGIFNVELNSGFTRKIFVMTFGRGGNMKWRHWAAEIGTAAKPGIARIGDPLTVADAEMIRKHFGEQSPV